ncbi:MAG: menaquinol-cytochrome C reductase [Bacillota bacterium]|nr:MAG: menaquinol-cytochrome C reductase [Bacillota bacterium]
MAEATEKYQQTGPKVRVNQKEELVYTWPYLVSIEAIMAIAMILALSLMATFVNAPLLELANPEKTPNPAKAPWYFLGLQELLLHMHPALAGVIVPTAALILLAMIPYIDRDPRGTGIWFSTRKGLPITIFSAVYTWIWEIVLILIDEFWVTTPAGTDTVLKGIEPHITYFLDKTFPFMTQPGWPGWSWVGKILLPAALMVTIPWVLAVIVKRRWKANTRELMIALFTFYFASFILLTIVGTAFRGHSMQLMWPWEVTAPH